jgi:hypothetical protein
LLLKDAKSLELTKFEDTLDVTVSFEALKTSLFPTMQFATQFLALMNSCKSGYFVSTKVALGENPMQKPGAHAITVGGPHDTALALGNVGSGKGTVFFELINAALNERDIKLAGTMVPPPGRETGIIGYRELLSYLDTSIGRVVNLEYEPYEGMLLEKNPRGEAEGGFFFVTDPALAEKTLREKFQKEYKEALGASSKTISPPPVAEAKSSITPSPTPAPEPSAKPSPPPASSDEAVMTEVMQLRAKLASLGPATSSIPLPEVSTGFLARQGPQNTLDFSPRHLPPHKAVGEPS